MVVVVDELSPTILTSYRTNSRDWFCVPGCARIPVHDLRHTHASIALQAAVHPKILQERLGHSNVKVTLDTYSHVMPPMHAEAAARIAAIVDGR